MERITSGIDNLDNLLNGGFIKNSLILVSGTIGSGKTTFALQCLYKNALTGKKCMFISTKSRNVIKNFLPRFQKLRELIKTKKIIFADISPISAYSIIKDIEFAVKSFNIEIITIDSVDILKMLEKHEARFALSKISHMLKRNKCTTILTSEAALHSKSLSIHGVEEFISDAVILLEMKKSNHKLLKNLHIRKMRGSPHSEKIYPYEIFDSGIKIEKI